MDPVVGLCNFYRFHCVFFFLLTATTIGSPFTYVGFFFYKVHMYSNINNKVHTLKNEILRYMEVATLLLGVRYKCS